MPAQFDVYRTVVGSIALLLPHPLLDGLPVWPAAMLRPADTYGPSFRHLEPIITSGDMRLVLSPYFLVSLAPGELGEHLFNASHQRDEIIRAFDVLLTGV